MKKKLSVCVSMVLCAVLFGMSGCFGTEKEPAPQTNYTIQYLDDEGRHALEVETGKLYTLETLPTRYGYDFLGLYDAQTGGTQYVDGRGYSLTAFSENRDLVLYPQFQAKEYTLILDYRGAEETGVRYLKIRYGEEIENLPLGLKQESKRFVGWYTEPERKGYRITDTYGVLPENRKFTEKLFDLSGADGNVKLYAGFESAEYTVTFIFGNGVRSETVTAEHGTPIGEIQPSTRVNGKAVLSWSKRANDGEGKDIFDGKVTGDMTLYAAEYAPVIDFDANGGKELPALIARTGEAITLPVPEKEHYKFIGWQDASGNECEFSVVPENSVKLYAKWQAMLVFDSNGGREVANISEPQGTVITLPDTERDGFVFAGWYRSDEKYEKTEMPAQSVVLTAKWYSYTKTTKVLLSENTEIQSWYETPTMSKSLILDLTELHKTGVSTIKVSVYYQSEVVTNLTGLTSMVWFRENIPSEAYKVWEYTDAKHTHIKSWTSQSYSTTLELNTDKFYICLCHNGWSSTGKWKNFIVEIEYLDMSTLY